MKRITVFVVGVVGVGKVEVRDEGRLNVCLETQTECS